VAVGDPRQAIYAFTGADSDAMDQIKEAFDCTDLELTITYRCPKAIVRHAQQWVSHIQAHDTAPEGEVVDMASQDALATVQKGDAILCRNTAPLVSMAFQLIRSGRAAHVEGKEIGKGLTTLTRKWWLDDAQEFLTRLRTWAAIEHEDLVSRQRGGAAAALMDKVETMEVLAEGCATVEDIRRKIGGIFEDTEKDDAKKRITLATIHRAKGREWNTVYWFGHSTLCPSGYAKTREEKTQEENLQYVATTRAKKRLVLVEE
jgi:superfamily I DNA/RNA helicase